MKVNAKKLTIIAMFSAIAYIIMVFLRIPIVLFLKYEPKDIIIAIGGFLLGPLASLAISFVVSFVEMISVSDTGIIGFVMNLLSSCTFACTAAVIYRKKRTFKGAVFGLLIGSLLTVITMLLWNYFITPIYMGYPREEVAKMLLPAFLPFNLIKTILNSGITILLYKPVVTALRKAKLLPESESENKKTNFIGVLLVALFLLITSVLMILVVKGVI